MAIDNKYYGYAYTSSFDQREFAADLTRILTDIRQRGASVEHISTDIVQAMTPDSAPNFQPQFIAQIVYLEEINGEETK